MNSANNNKRGGDYEKLILEKIMYEFDENFSYELNYRIQGIVSKTVREFDIAIFRKDEQHPFWIIECKNWKEDQVKNKFIKEIEQMPIKIKKNGIRKKLKEQVLYSMLAELILLQDC